MNVKAIGNLKGHYTPTWSESSQSKWVNIELTNRDLEIVEMLAEVELDRDSDPCDVAASVQSLLDKIRRVLD